jgi:hypothetical protein
MYLYNATAQLPGCHDPSEYSLHIALESHGNNPLQLTTIDYTAIPCSSDSKIRGRTSRQSNFPQKPKRQVWGRNLHHWKEQQFPGHTRASVERVLFQLMR